MKHTLRAIGAVVLAGGLLVGCGGGQAGQTTPTPSHALDIVYVGAQSTLALRGFPVSEEYDCTNHVLLYVTAYAEGVGLAAVPQAPPPGVTCDG